jgi:hypothetical protein
MGCVTSKANSNILTSIPPIVKRNIDGTNNIRKKSEEQKEQIFEIEKNPTTIDINKPLSINKE